MKVEKVELELNKDNREFFFGSFFLQQDGEQGESKGKVKWDFWGQMVQRFSFLIEVIQVRVSYARVELQQEVWFGQLVLSG